MEDKFKNIKSYIDDVMYDKTNNTLGDWISDYGGVVNENYTITFGSHFALQKMLDRRDKEVIRIALSHAINSHDELVENVLHYKADALMWERRAVTEASRAQELVAEVGRLRNHVKNLKHLAAHFSECGGWDVDAYQEYVDANTE